MLADIAQTKRLAERLAGQVRAGDVIALSGEVGAGKTTFAQAFIGALLRTPESITSPTFTLVQDYATKHDWRIVHADLYRLKNTAELAELGLEDAFESAVTLIEWPDIATDMLPEHTLHITLQHAPNDQRNIILTSTSQRWSMLMKEIAA